MTAMTVTLTIIDYAHIQHAAQCFARRLPAWASVDANDLAQESILAALRGRKSRKGPMQDALRKQGWMKRHRSGGETIRVALDERTYGHSPESRLVAKIDIELLLNRLPPNQREAVVLHHLVGMTETEMSKSLTISIPMVKNRIYRGLTSMRNLIMKENKGTKLVEPGFPLRRGFHPSSETRTKIALSKLGYHHSEETNRKMSRSLKAYWQSPEGRMRREMTQSWVNGWETRRKNQKELI